MAALQGWDFVMKDWRAGSKYDGTPAHNRWLQTGRKMFTGNQVTGTFGGLFVPNACAQVYTTCTRSLVRVKDLRPVCAEGKIRHLCTAPGATGSHKVQFIICRRGMLPTLMLNGGPALLSMFHKCMDILFDISKLLVQWSWLGPRPINLMNQRMLGMLTSFLSADSCSHDSEGTVFCQTVNCSSSVPCWSVACSKAKDNKLVPLLFSYRCHTLFGI